MDVAAERGLAVEGHGFTYHWGGEGGQQGFPLLGNPVALVQEHSILEGEGRVSYQGWGAAKAPPGMLPLSLLIPLSAFSKTKYIYMQTKSKHTKYTNI